MTRYDSETYYVLLATVLPTFWFVCLVFGFLKSMETKKSEIKTASTHDVNLTSFFRRVKFVPPKPNLICHIINIVDKEEMKKGSRWAKQKSFVCSVFNGCEFCLHTPSVFLGCSKSLLKGWPFLIHRIMCLRPCSCHLNVRNVHSCSKMRKHIYET